MTMKHFSESKVRCDRYESTDTLDNTPHHPHTLFWSSPVLTMATALLQGHGFDGLNDT